MITVLQVVSTTCWGFAFIVEGILLAFLLEAVLCVKDLERDAMNAHTCARRMNNLVVPEILLQGIQLAVLVFCGKWSLVCCNVSIVLWHLRLYFKGEAYIEATDIFSNLEKHRKVRLIKFGMYIVIFVGIVYRLLEAAVILLLAAQGKPYSLKFFTTTTFSQLTRF
mmetsp:Transcript_16088/g.22215  ORF Transcript_16088/g.22215 Transcript_16088/m.22215 type:complete len:166 (-) Transcript_16088:7-504(-)